MTALAALLAWAPAFAQEPDPRPSPEPEGTPIEFSAGLNAYDFYNLNKVNPVLRVSTRGAS
jgi:hypothetical protein